MTHKTALSSYQALTCFFFFFISYVIQAAHYAVLQWITFILQIHNKSVTVFLIVQCSTLITIFIEFENLGTCSPSSSYTIMTLKKAVPANCDSQHIPFRCCVHSCTHQNSASKLKAVTKVILLKMCCKHLDTLRNTHLCCKLEYVCFCKTNWKVDVSVFTLFQYVVL